MLSKLLLNCVLALSIGGALGGIVPFSTKAAVSIVQNQIGDDDTRIYFQPEAGTIAEISTNGPFDTERMRGSPFTIVPSNEVLQGTPISAVVVGNFTEIHVFFLSPDRVLSEYLWTPTTSWIGGTRCPQCVTSKGFKVSLNQNALSATVNPVTRVLGVGFITAPSAPIAETLVEAVKRSGDWVLAPLQDSSATSRV